MICIDFAMAGNLYEENEAEKKGCIAAKCASEQCEFFF